MSTINKKPFIKSLVEDMTVGQIATLQQLVDGGGDQNALLRTMNIKPVGNRTHITEDDKGVHLCNLEANFSLFNGYLIYTDHYCVLIHFTDSQVLGMFNIDLNDLTKFATVSEELSVLELRNELNDTQESEQADILQTVEDALDNGDLKIVSNNINSGTTEVGKVLTSNGEGGAAWTETRTYKVFPQSWDVSHTTKDFCDDVAADTTAVAGMAYLGEVYFSDMPESIANSEIVVEIMTGTTAANKVIKLTLTSGNVEPYHWEYTYWNNGTDVSGWVEMGGGADLDEDVTVEIENNYSSNDYRNRTNYAEPISLQEFIANCEAGNVYTNPGIIAKINNLINGMSYSLILVGTNYGMLARGNTETANTMWQFLRAPVINTYLGLPFDIMDDGKDNTMDYLLGINANSMRFTSSNKGGYISAQGLLDACHTVFESLPTTLKRAIKTIQRKHVIKRGSMDVAANGGYETNIEIDCYMPENVFLLTGTELGWDSGPSGEGSVLSYLQTPGNRIRYMSPVTTGATVDWWMGSPSDTTKTWGYIIGSTGGYSTSVVTMHHALVPCFCI